MGDLVDFFVGLERKLPTIVAMVSRQPPFKYLLELGLAQVTRGQYQGNWYMLPVQFLQTKNLSARLLLHR